jgi:hypothetical protein
MECGADELRAAECHAFLTTLSSRVSKSFVRSSTDDEGNLWANLNVSEKDIDGLSWTQLITQLWNAELFQQPFRYAFAGLEVEQVRSYTELLEEEDLSIFPYLAVSEVVWVALGRPQTLIEVESGKHARLQQ